jgi:hypothetical protein
MTVRRPNFEYRLARAHARSGDRGAIASYLGKSVASYLGKSNAIAIAGFSSASADQIEEEYQSLVETVAR